MEWLRDNYMSLIEIIVPFLCLIVMLIKFFLTRNYDYFSTILLSLPEWIQEAESKYSDGSDKLAYVLNKCITLINTFNLSNKKKETLSVQCVAYIESILACPQKKGVNSETQSN